MKSIEKHLRESKNSFIKNLNPRFNFHGRIGHLGESLALNHLLKNKYILIDKNWKSSIGELDLICLDQNQYVFVEVKTRIDSRLARTHIFATISNEKKKRLQLLAKHYYNIKLKNRSFIENNARYPAYRIDIIGVVLKRDHFKVNEIYHIANAF